jgi:hypothetical protein
VLGELAAVDGEQKRPWTRIKYTTQRRKYEVCSAAEAAAYPGTCTATATRCVSAAQRQQHILAHAQPQARQGGCRLIPCLLCLQWFCEHNNYNPNLAEPDLAEKVTNYMWWVSKNCPGYDYPKKPEEMVSPCHAHRLRRSQPLYPAPRGQSLLVKTHSSYKCCLAGRRASPRPSRFMLT